MNTTCHTAKDRHYQVGILREELRRVDTRLVRYRFCTLRFAQPQYYIEILFGEERAAALLGEDHPTSQILFDTLVDGVVTPCTLGDIMEDIKNAQAPLQT